LLFAICDRPFATKTPPLKPSAPPPNREYLKLFDNTEQKNAICGRQVGVISANDPAAMAGRRQFATLRATWL
jgi:hypothetical protein